MADAGLFIGFGEPVRGRERAFGEVFAECVRYFEGLDRDGRIMGWEPVFLEHCGDLAGFMLLRGDAETLALIRIDETFTRLMIRLSLAADHLDVEGAELGERLRRSAEYWDTQVSRLP